MIDRPALKLAAKQSIPGKKPSVYLVAAIYIIIISILSVLSYALAGLDRYFAQLMQTLPVEPVVNPLSLMQNAPAVAPAAAVLIVLIFAVRLAVDIGFISYCLKLSRNEEADMKSLFDSFAFFFKAIWLAVLRTVIVLLCSVLLIVPGVVAFYSYRQAFYILLDNPHLSAWECLKLSKAMMDGYKIQLFALDVSFIGWYIVDLIIEVTATLRLFSIWLAPYAGITRAGFYNVLKLRFQTKSDTP